VVTPPVINSFNAAPAGIAAGAASTLSWEVSNAVAVTINQGVGSVGLTGTRVVSPAVTTTYTLTAANTAYFGQATAKVTVAAAAAAKPDLIIEDIWKVGDKMYYRIKNQGTAASPVTWSELKVDGTVKAQDAVAALAAGVATTRSFAGYAYLCTGISDSVVVTADTTNVAMESNGANNSMTKTFTCLALGPLVPLGPLVALKPDLTITQITYMPLPLNRVSYTVKNSGNLNAGAFDVKLYVGGVYKDTSHVAALNSGSQVTNTFPVYHHPVCMIGSHSTMKVVADTGAALTESDETNNSRTEIWGCPP
jgi:subtilase family serine protease